MNARTGRPDRLYKSQAGASMGSSKSDREDQTHGAAAGSRLRLHTGSVARLESEKLVAAIHLNYIRFFEFSQAMARHRNERIRLLACHEWCSDAIFANNNGQTVRLPPNGVDRP
jgi:hypothetical protein